LSSSLSQSLDRWFLPFACPTAPSAPKGGERETGGVSEARRFEDVDDEVDGPGVLERRDSSTVNEFWDPA
jgi:hypothetical protein